MQKPKIRIHYCPKCRWVLRATWMLQEILFTFPEDLSEVSLVPSEAGTFEVWFQEELLFSRKKHGRFPEAKEIKQLIRDRIDPERSLGHSDR